MLQLDGSEGPPREAASHPKRTVTLKVMKIGTPLGEVLFICGHFGANTCIIVFL